MPNLGNNKMGFIAGLVSQSTKTHNNNIMENKDQKRLTSIEKALAIIMIFTPYNQDMGTIEISKKMGLDKGTTSRILGILTKNGFLMRDPATQKFRLGRAALDLGRAVVRSLDTDIVARAKPYVDRLRTAINETCGLEIVSGSNLFLAYTAHGSHYLRFTPSTGDKMPIHASAGSKAILAHLEPELVQKLLKGNDAFKPLTPNTITDSDVFMRQLKKIKETGIALDCEEVDVGINGIGTPIFNHNNMLIASLAVAGPSSRVKADYDSPIIPELKKTAKKISESLLLKNDKREFNLDSPCPQNRSHKR